MKIIAVKVIPNAKQNCVVPGEQLKFYVKAPAAGGKANKALIEVLAAFFQIRKTAVSIVKGKKAREKIICLRLD